MEIKQRQHFLDIIRIVATCAVVLLHTVTGVTDNTDMALYPFEQKIFLILKDLSCWCVPVFIMISGYLFLNPEKELTIGLMLKKYCRRVALALLLFGIPYAWLELMATEGVFRPAMLWQGAVMVLQGKSWAHIWYLYLILFLYLFTPAMRWFLKRMPIEAVYAVAVLLFVGGSILPFFRDLLELSRLWTLPLESIYLFYYLCGYLFVCRKKQNPVICRLFFALALLTAGGMAVSRAAGFTMNPVYSYPFTVILSLSIFSMALSGEQRRKARGTSPMVRQNTGLWEYAAQLSFAVYLIHPVFLNLAYKLFKVTPLSFSIGISLPLFFAGILILSTAGAWGLRKIPFLRKYVL